MAANYTASTINIFLNVVGSSFLRLNSFLIQKNTQHQKTPMINVVTGNANNTLI